MHPLCSNEPEQVMTAMCTYRVFLQAPTRPAPSQSSWHRAWPGSRRVVQARGSLDGEDVDHELSAELARRADPKRVERMQKHLELIWRIAKSRKPESCSCCNGTGEKECDWCHGTGFMTVGDTIFTNPGSNQCPVCKAKGYTKCEKCRGTGHRAQWLGQDDTVAGLAQ
ncbi:hypothetical protein V8C86DRAFT_2484611 [Haematococcus lacustris]